MPYKQGVSFEQHFPRADPAALRLLRRLIAFDPADRPSSEEALNDPYFVGGRPAASYYYIYYHGI